MKVQCILCDKIEVINQDSIIAKRLRNRPIHTYMCEECTNRVTEKAQERLAKRKNGDDSTSEEW
ncbi:YlaI family protein [Heyndrickxia acidicola]|uniref:YlaI family protein n=1 Tax=Heyndrickxia acidicola TaxID=209389 RepID=A0ABU6MHR5_9BACI|nr:YlaI family protein [Heyndrickxia acidicola]MED1204221.1 YlaI family protein [Heyndrickxia acidicola]